MNLTKNWHIGTLSGTSALLYNGNGSDNDPNKDTQSDGYFTVKGDVKTAGESNAYPLVTWGTYENAIKVNSKTDIQFTAPEGSTLEFIAHIQNNKAGAISVDSANAVSVTTDGQPTGAEGVTVKQERNISLRKMPHLQETGQRQAMIHHPRLILMILR